MRHVIAAGVAALALAGCSDPMERVTRLSDVELNEAAPTVEMAEPASEAEAEKTGGLFARLFQPKTTAPGRATAGDAADDTTRESRPAATEDAAENAKPDTGDATPSAPSDDDRPRGLFGLFARNGQGGSAPGRIDPDAPDAQVVSPGTAVPYGTVARVCDMPRRDMGQKVADYPERRAQYTLYDSAPGGTGPRAFYMTGFPDGCARQFTAALAMFGSPRMHEQLRYGAPADSLPYSDTDKAYERIKRRVCGVGRNKPCGARISRLERDTAFVTIYERFGENARWATMLVHGGAVVAADLKSGN
ncbi:hypothetical protein M8756_15960 [Lutimaribacter sp. EGI FJ00015]|uniref:Uncharacterized protein n=1 Tax=Lutimaribacter degradans TaxID=2945989 RepID=A0ACC5ZZP2_9RHOB|nr:hypothetical protein [Lutimaribacter sp. EGI FJ00013]MCM2563650.1 hypothetical protein [Lutimaribacter sp. EGI FJ00013]MCO0614814.1 hypothetical protein [Lutimaribacter sp. EGI FJ00015]MCO0637502.1 hypothetical protein [Lutimaribacter sp. EGI FJ00014]